MQGGPATQSLDYLINHFCEVFGHSTDFSSVSEKLYYLKQDKMSIQDYSLKFRTLAAACGWNELSLLTTYCQDLNPQLRLHLATYSDTIGLERFIQTANQVSNRIRHCNEELQVTLHHQPEWESAPEPMQIGNHPTSVHEEAEEAGPGSLFILWNSWTCYPFMSNLPPTICGKCYPGTFC